MNKTMLTATAFLAVLVGHAAARSMFAQTLTLAENGRTKYVIVIASEPQVAEKQAADELAYFLEEMTGVTLPIVRDDTPKGNFEIVLGHTDRKRLEDVPANLRTDNWEGYTLLREGDSLVIIGNIPRATLYGVYDFLDLDLGVRFLTDRVNHVPKHETLKVVVTPRTYGPPLEHRTVYQALMGHSGLRNRMNASGFQVIDEKNLGGVKPVGRPTHTFDILVPREKYFKTNPEFFPLIEGKRRDYYEGEITQLCLTNPDVLLLSMERVREWMKAGVHASPWSKVVASVSANDSVDFCQCGPCVAVAREDGSENDGGAGAAHLRMVNAIARRVAEEFPQASISTMLYHSRMPRKIKPAPNVIMRMVSGIDWRYRLDDPNSEANVNMSKILSEWRDKVGNGLIYNWSKHVHFGNFFAPIPNLREIATNIRIYHEKYRLGGLFAQNQQSRGTEMQSLRFYLLAKAMWRPTVDSRETIKEFCVPYYGSGAEGVMKYIDYLHDEWRDRLYKGGDGRHGDLDLSEQEVEKLVSDSERILARAEVEADTPETKLRVAECRLPNWNMQLNRAFGTLGQIVALPETWRFKFDHEGKGEGSGLAEKWYETEDLSGWEPMKIDNHWTFQGENRRGTAWYGVQFDAPSTDGAPLAIYFGAVDGDADVFMDGRKVGEQKINASAMWNHGFFIPLHDGLAPGRHTLMVRVFKHYANAGIWRPVSIVDMSVPLSDRLRTAADRFVNVARFAQVSYISESYAGRDTQTEMILYPKIRFFAQHGTDRLHPWIRSDADMARIEDPAAITDLILSGSMVTAEGLRHLASMTNLRKLEMRLLRSVNGEDLAPLAELHSLRHLDLWQTKIGNDGLKHLAGLSNLESLDLAETTINDAGLQHLAGLTKLAELSLVQTRVSDAGLEHLKGLANLRLITVGDGKLIDPRTDRLSPGAEQLMKDLPKLEIRRY